MGFETRYRRFVVVQGISLLNERVVGPLRLKHVLYSFFAVLLTWRGLASGSAQVLGLAAVVGLLTLLSALYPRRSMSFETHLLALLVSLVDVAASVGGRAPSSKKRSGRSAGAVTGRATATKSRGALYAGVALTAAGALVLACSVLLKSTLLVMAGGFPIGLGLALALGGTLKRGSS